MSYASGGSGVFLSVWTFVTFSPIGAGGTGKEERNFQKGERTLVNTWNSGDLGVRRGVTGIRDCV